VSILHRRGEGPLKGLLPLDLWCDRSIELDSWMRGRLGRLGLDYIARPRSLFPDLPRRRRRRIVCERESR